MEKKRCVGKQGSVIFTAVVTSFITTFMGSALNLSAPEIGEEFQVSAASVGWVVTVYMLTCAALAVPLGRLADVLGREKILRIGILIFAASSAAAGFSKSMAMLLALRFAQGLGASMIFSTNVAILVAAFDESMRGKVLGYAASATYVGLSAGPVLGGFLNHSLGWRSVFIAAACVSAAAFMSALRRLPKEGSRIQKTFGMLDVPGCAAYVFSVTAAMYGLSAIRTSMAAPFALAAGAAAFILFVRIELRAEEPVVRVDMFRKDVSYACSNLAALLNYGATFAVSYLLSVYLQTACGLNSRAAGTVLIASPLVMSVLSPVMGRLSDRHSPHVMSSLGMAVCALSLAFLAFITERTSPPVIIGILALSGVGSALFSSPNTNAVMASVEREDYGAASSVLATMRSTGHTAGMAAVMAVAGIYMGDMSLAEAGPELLIKTMRTCFLIFTGLCAAGVFIALKRKR